MKDRKIEGYDILRIIAAFMVIIIHANVAFLANRTRDLSWFIGMEITTICLLAVPIFFMISGATLLGKKKISSSNEYIKRFFKQLAPFLIWSLIYVIARIVMGKIPFQIKSLWNLLSEPAYYQFWFMYSLLSIYLLLPFLECIVCYCGKKYIEYALILWFIFSVGQPVLVNISSIFKISTHFDLRICEGYIGFFLLGYYLREYYLEVSIKKSVYIFLLGIILMVLQSGLEYIFVKENYQGYFYRDYLTPGVVFASSGIFMLFQNIKVCLHFMVKKLAELTLGIYYIHMLVLTAIEYLGITGNKNLFLCEIKALIVFFISIILVVVMKKIKICRTLVG